MAEPENHTLRVLREFREEFREFRKETDGNFTELKDRIDSLARVVAGESVLGRYAAAEIEERLSAIEKRLAALEQQR
jgi:polyhydroxyalkanoate synthesis regulator phasin